MSVSEQALEKPASEAAGWLTEHGDALFRYAMARVRDPDVAEELVQDALVTAIEARERFAGRSTDRTWLIGILRHKLLQYFCDRPRHGAANAPEDFLPESILEKEFNEKGRWRTGPAKWSSAIEQDELRRALVNCLEKLPPRAAEAFLLAERHEIAPDELRNALKVSSTNHVYVLLHRARTALRLCLERTWAAEAAKG